MKNIGIVTTIFGDNFGEALQAFAVRKAINTYCDDCNAELISFICGNQVNLVKLGFEQYTKQLLSKRELFDEFRHNEIGISSDPVRKLTVDNAPLFDKYVFGSDQIWNTNVWEVPEFFGSFVPGGKTKIAYAASVGAKVETLRSALFEQYIKTFDYLSVREYFHRGYIDSFTDKNKKTEFVADPTLLLDTSVYEQLKSKVNLEKPDNYIFYYQPHSSDGAIVSLVNKYARLNSFDVVHTFAEIPENTFPHRSLSARFFGPREFLSYISDASLVITRSYHAMIFAILFRKPFYVYVDKKTGSRFESLLITLGLEDRLVYDYLSPDKINLEIDYDKVYEKLDAFKHSSISFLKDALA
jgi:hypothetical protein